jgi:cytochrome b involved in lipid metabolism
LFGEAGRDATEAFEDVGHSDEARALLDKYYVGEGPEVSLYPYLGNVLEVYWRWTSEGENRYRKRGTIARWK